MKTEEEIRVQISKMYFHKVHDTRPYVIRLYEEQIRMLEWCLD